MCMRFLLELGSSPENHISSSSRKMRNLQDMHQGKFQFIYSILSTRKSEILNNLEFLEPVKEVTEWVNSFVIMEIKVPTDSSNSHSLGHSVFKKLQICLDPRGLNKALEKEPYYTHSIKEIVGKFHRMKWFTIADFNKGYRMVVLHPDSRKLTTMALDIVRFQWTRLPMGSIVAQDVFQRKLDAIFLDVPGVTGIAVDMTIYGKDDLEHDGNLLNFWKYVGRTTLH